MTSDTSIPRTSTGHARPSLRRPSALRLLALAAAHAGDDEAMSGAAGPVTFRALHRRVSVSAITLAERGVAPDAALRATVTALMPRAGLSGSQLATAAAGIVDELDRRITEILGLGDRESLPGLFRIAARRRADAVALADLEGRRSPTGNSTNGRTVGPVTFSAWRSDPRTSFPSPCSGVPPRWPRCGRSPAPRCSWWA